MMTYLNIFILIFLLLAAAFMDAKDKRIPNILTFPLILIGLILNIIINGISGIGFSFLGFLLGLAIFFIPFAVGLMGGGDVKLMAAIGALMGWKFTLISAIFSAIAGIGVVFVYLIYKGRLFNYFRKYFVVIGRTILKYIDFSEKNIIGSKLKGFSYSDEAKEEENAKLYVPYGVSIAIGTLFVLWKFQDITNFLT